MKKVKEQQEQVLLKATEKRLRHELSLLKRKKVMSAKDLDVMKRDSVFWSERLHGPKKKFTPLERLEFDYWLKRRAVNTEKIKHMIWKCKEDPRFKPIHDELHHYGLDIRMLYVDIYHLNNRIAELKNQLSSIKGMCDSTPGLVYRLAGVA